MGRSRRLLVTAAVGAASLTVASSTIGVSALPGSRTETSRTRVGAVIRVVRVEGDVGDVRLAPATRTVVEVSERWLLARPDVRIALRGDVLDISASCPDVPLNDCRVDFDITVPAAATSIVDVGAGSIEVGSLAGNHHLETEAGSIEGTDLGSRTATIEAAADAGTVELHDIRARTIETSSGSGDVSVDAAELTGSLLAMSGGGDVDVAVPAGAYAVFAEAKSGRRAVHGVTNDPMAARSITAASGAGSVVVRARGTTVPPELDDDEPTPRPGRDSGADDRQPRSTTTTTRPPRSTSTTAQPERGEESEQGEETREPRPRPEDDDERGPGFPILDR